jgi:hypothetical protein
MKRLRPAVIYPHTWALVAWAILTTGCLKGLVLSTYPASEFNTNPTSITVSGLSDRHAVALVCSKELWNAFLAHKGEFVATVDPKHGSISLAIDESSSLNCDKVPDSHLLFYLDASDRATILLTLPETLLRHQNKEWRIIVFSSPSQRLEL